MALKAKAMNKKVDEKPKERTHEVRLDHEGKGYLYRFDKKHQEKPEEAKVEEKEADVEKTSSKSKKKKK